MSKTRVSYFYDNDIGNFSYAPGHPMKPHRVRMTHNLLLNYGLYSDMEIFRPRLLMPEEMKAYHSEEYINFLHAISPENASLYKAHANRFNFGDDCTIFDGLFRYCQISAGGSVGGAVRLNQGKCDVAINWSGGLHHAKKSEASGFCYVNDIVLAILELLKVHPRVMYIDIDVHHGDGVEEAFYTTDRVMTISFHKYGEFFPGTGSIKDIGAGRGKYYAVNFPLKDGIDDHTFQFIFQPIIAKAMDVYRPTAVVLQCGADSLTQDRLGCFNLTLRGHGECVEFVKSFGLPLLLLGGGGYTIRNVARCWTHETAIALGTQLDDVLPFNEFFQYYGPSYRLHIVPSTMENMNSIESLRAHSVRILDVLSRIEGAPSVVMSASAIPRPAFDPDLDSALNDEDEDRMTYAQQRHTTEMLGMGPPTGSAAEQYDAAKHGITRERSKLSLSASALLPEEEAELSKKRSSSSESSSTSASSTSSSSSNAKDPNDVGFGYKWNDAIFRDPLSFVCQPLPWAMQPYGFTTTRLITDQMRELARRVDVSGFDGMEWARKAQLHLEQRIAAEKAARRRRRQIELDAERSGMRAEQFLAATHDDDEDDDEDDEDARESKKKRERRRRNDPKEASRMDNDEEDDSKHQGSSSRRSPKSGKVAISTDIQLPQSGLSLAGLSISSDNMPVSQGSSLFNPSSRVAVYDSDTGMSLTIDPEAPTSVQGMRQQQLFHATHAKGEDRERITQRMIDTQRGDPDEGELESGSRNVDLSRGGATAEAEKKLKEERMNEVQKEKMREMELETDEEERQKRMRMKLDEPPQTSDAPSLPAALPSSLPAATPVSSEPAPLPPPEGNAPTTQ
eukprot:MONOS_7005.1-p1 / transcript=MONOS_7005.1 / gene=MONOS_7005 / organism=Monocercomonoides_exilis_PA203 / gene_product=histone deacetylase Rpd3 / transcript_product=histone deacetylase Rpd3 / location=Mono_scaffold00230:74257-77358(-) / protein_length=846 / sequence_SO=supercontig / SO=protein_coding / is_pseudo=false